MMKAIHILILVSLSLFLAACTAPPSDVPLAEVVDETNKQEVAIEPVQNSAGNDEEQVTQPTAVEKTGDVAIDATKSTFEFEGFAVGKSHAGTFDVWSGTLVYGEDGLIQQINGVIDATSVNTGIGGLDDHLKNEDFFEVETYPEISIALGDVQSDSITGDITFRGVTKTVTFPAEVTSEYVKTDFLLDTTEFDMKHAGVDKKVRIAFEFYPTE